ncbi:copper transport protein [Natronorubrum sediminis]|uniref:Copper transport protein n=1 Tax=Natronorubrum sediminis TaxID=640943 RepID=A0A1H6FYI2_9EURY|nr:FixH family protein [Natronorubrum sediminis]SEH15857.1 copper transport protein [Natronorubrum sediminis]
MRSNESALHDHRTQSRAKRGLTVLAIAFVVALVLASVATPVAAHAYLSETDPENGEQLESAPDDITLTFSGDGVQNADISIVGPDGEDVSGDAEIDPDDTQLVDVPFETEDDAEGMYTVEWEVLADDGHTTSGTFFFSVGDEPLDRDSVLETYEDEDEVDESVPPLESAARGLLLVSLVGLVGAPVTAAMAVYPVADRAGVSKRAVDDRLTTLLAVLAAGVLTAVALLGYVQATSIGSPSLETFGEFLGMPLGQAWLVQAVLALGLAVVLGSAVAGKVPRSVWLGGTFVGAIGVGGALSWTSHSATAIDRLQGTAVDFAHIAGAGLWLGGLVVLALVVPAMLRDAPPADRSALAAGTIRRYSLLALAGVTLAGATGLALAAWHVPDLEAIGATFYGTVLTAKTLLVIVALGLGGLTRFVFLRRLESDGGRSRFGFLDRFGGGDAGGTDAEVREDGGRSSNSTGAISAFTRTVRLEVGVIVLVLLLTGLLTSVPTAAVVGDDDGPETATIEREGDVDLELTAIPAATDTGGDDRIHVQQDDPVVFEVTFLDDGGEPVESDQTVRLTADGEDTFDVDLEQNDDGTYSTVQPFPSDGDWELRITGEPDGAFVSEWVDVYVSPGDDADGEHDDEGHDHGDHDHGDEADYSAFATLLQFGAVAIGVVGSVAVTMEALRFRGRSE